MAVQENIFGITEMAEGLRAQMKDGLVYPRPFYLQIEVDTVLEGKEPGQWISLDARLYQFKLQPQDPSLPFEQFFLDPRSKKRIATINSMTFDHESVPAPVVDENGVEETSRIGLSSDVCDSAVVGTYRGEILVTDSSDLDDYFDMLCRAFQRHLLQHCIDGLKNPVAV